MIQVQIASQLTAQGMAGVRWVLVEPTDAPPASGPAPVAQALPPAPDAAAAAETAPPGDSTASALRLGALKLLVVALGLAAAWWTAHVQVGPPGAAQAVPAPAPVLAPAEPPAAPPAAPPGAADPAAPAGSAALPRLTAAL